MECFEWYRKFSEVYESFKAISCNADYPHPDLKQESNWN